MKKLALGVASAAALCAATAHAGDAMGIGAARCDEVAGLWDNAGAAERSQLLIAIGQWSFGYLSALNAGAPVNARRELGRFDNDDTANFIISRCREFPNVYIYDIVDIIYEATPYMSADA